MHVSEYLHNFVNKVWCDYLIQCKIPHYYYIYYTQNYRLKNIFNEKSHRKFQDPSLLYEFLKELFILFIMREMVFLTCLYEILTLDQNICNFMFILFASFKKLIVLHNVWNVNKGHSSCSILWNLIKFKFLKFSMLFKWL